MSENALEVVEQKQISFYEDEITVLVTEDGTVYVPIRPICNLLGIAWTAQRLRINRDPVLSEVARPMIVTITGHAHGKLQDVETISLPLDYLNGWLFGITVSRVKSHLQETLIRYQRECYRVLADAFVHDKVTHRPDPAFEELLKTDSPTAQAYKMIMAMAQMARQQLLIESRLDSAESDITEIDSRVQILEARGGDKTRQIDNAQASRISQAVKAISIELGKRSGRNEFGGVWGELYRRFEISGYRELPAVQFDKAIHFLSDWYSSLTNTETPF
jgi:hypothetical protein